MCVLSKCFVGRERYKEATHVLFRHSLTSVRDALTVVALDRKTMMVRVVMMMTILLGVPTVMVAGRTSLFPPGWNGLAALPPMGW